MITLRFAPNFASTAQGAQATGDAAPVIGPTGAVVQTAPQVLKNLIDDTETTDWQAAATQGTDGAWNVDGRQATIDLAGTQPADDPPRPGQRADRAGLRFRRPR